MITSSEEFTQYAEAERRLCAEAGPKFAEIIREVEASAGLLIGEVRVTFDRTINNGQLISANCTIVRAVPASGLGGNMNQEHGCASKQAAAD